MHPRMRVEMDTELQHADAYPVPSGITMEYGTAGFRAPACNLPHVMYRMGLLAVLRARYTRGVIGVMVTASHNPEEDNGVKLMEGLGDMLSVSWEKHATSLASAQLGELRTQLSALLRDCPGSESSSPVQKYHVLIGQDTRASSKVLAQAVSDGVTDLGGTFKDFGLVTTPQLHYLVASHNSDGLMGEPSLDGYYRKLSEAYKALMAQAKPQPKIEGSYPLTMDGANGVGAPKMVELLSYLKSSLAVKIINNGESGKLNHECGADYVKIGRRAPKGLQMLEGRIYCSLDGDADRLLYYFVDKSGTFHLVDGDKISTLMAIFIQHLLKEAQLPFQVSVLQTAYANGSSTRYLKDTLQLQVYCLPTGVKYLHTKAKECDIGVYFEANGHGTVLFGKRVLDKVAEVMQDSSKPETQRAAATQLYHTSQLINQAVGDALSDLLAVEAMLSLLDLSLPQLYALYTDIPSRLLKVKVIDRQQITTTDAERSVTHPEGLQAAIEERVHHHLQARAFVRPSGTEDMVRVYAESKTQESADCLAHEVALLVHRLAGGVGEEPRATT
uniref:Phosphoacetylglucosamine mutase n=1 Tax=Eptatretus burgeri TaxID=7764 RepID=A0A8C4PXJ9_EPTBU